MPGQGALKNSQNLPKTNLSRAKDCPSKGQILHDMGSIAGPLATLFGHARRLYLDYGVSYSFPY
jgi:hypothetical protein